VAEIEIQKTKKKIREKKLESLKGAREFKSVTSLVKGDVEKQEIEERVFERPEPNSPWGGKDLGSLAIFFWKRDGIGMRIS